MATNTELEVSRHVEATLEFLHEDLKLKRLLALTYSRAEAGQAAIDLVLPLFCGPRTPPWHLVHLSGEASVTLKMLDDCLAAFEQLRMWSACDIESAIAGTAASLQTSTAKLSALISYMVFGNPPGIPIGDLLEFFGKSQSLSTLRRNTETFRSMNLIS
ncbi:hypothetical protein [Eleftheria terrae]|uniref:hypothetical protein n=1 Tax=Eleftheria terrae TaxID=1597781 RepID=UPI00263A79FB|nr:hypothetical protein [Eleftheria terrae]WKB55586.1 hypothetical protein N7L95_26290 [Eleftheria terrae]